MTRFTEDVKQIFRKGNNKQPFNEYLDSNVYIKRSSIIKVGLWGMFCGATIMIVVALAAIVL